MTEILCFDNSSFNSLNSPQGTLICPSLIVSLDTEVFLALCSGSAYVDVSTCVLSHLTKPRVDTDVISGLWLICSFVNCLTKTPSSCATK